MATKTDEMKRYVVTVGAVMLPTGQTDPTTKRPITARILKGSLINADPNHPDIKEYLASKSIAEFVEGEPVRSSSARDVVRALGAPGDPVTPPQKDFLPLPAPDGVIAPTEV